MASSICLDHVLRQQTTLPTWPISSVRSTLFSNNPSKLYIARRIILMGNPQSLKDPGSLLKKGGCASRLVTSHPFGSVKCNYII